MEAEEIAVVLFADLVSGKDDDVLRIVALDEWNVLVDGICSSFIDVYKRQVLSSKCRFFLE